MTSVLFCVKGDTVAVEAALKGVTGYDSVASVLKKKGQYNVFLRFPSDEAAAAATDVLKQNPLVVLPGEKKVDESAQQQDEAAVGKKKQKQLATQAAATYFNYESYDQMRDRKEAEARQQAAVERKKSRQSSSRGGASEPAAAGAKSDAEADQSGRGGRGGARGGRRGGRGGRGFSRQRVPMIQGYVAVLDNVPFCTTNDQIARLFMTCGAIYDINRLETMAMVYFDTTEAVQRAILAMNGQKIFQNTITVSSGGCVRVPAPVMPPPPQMIPPQSAAPPQ